MIRSWTRQDPKRGISTRTPEQTFSKAIEAVSPDVSMATTSGSGLGTGRMCFECT